MLTANTSSVRSCSYSGRPSHQQTHCGPSQLPAQRPFTPSGVAVPQFPFGHRRVALCRSLRRAGGRGRRSKPELAAFLGTWRRRGGPDPSTARRGLLLTLPVDSGPHSGGDGRPRAAPHIPVPREARPWADLGPPGFPATTNFLLADAGWFGLAVLAARQPPRTFPCVPPPRASPHRAQLRGSAPGLAPALTAPPPPPRPSPRPPAAASPPPPPPRPLAVPAPQRASAIRTELLSLVTCRARWPFLGVTPPKPPASL